MTEAQSVYLQLQKVARDRKRPVEEIFTFYGLERFLARLADTSYAEDFCLKGGVLLSAHALRRPTRDIDMQALDFQLDTEHVTEVVKQCATTSLSTTVWTSRRRHADRTDPRRRRVRWPPSPLSRSRSNCRRCSAEWWRCMATRW